MLKVEWMEKGGFSQENVSFSGVVTVSGDVENLLTKVDR